MDAGPQDQKKRTLEALERRFAVAKAELLQQQKKIKNTSPQEDGKTMPGKDSSLVSALPITDALLTSNSSSFRKKGSFSFAGQKASQDAEENDLAYSQLSQPIHENLLSTNEKFSGRRGSMVDKFLHVLLQSGDSAQKYLHGSRSYRIDNWILLDNYVQVRGGSTNTQMMDLRSHSKRSKKHMSMKRLKKCGLLDLPRSLQKFDMFKPMHDVWKSYVMQLVKTTGKNQLAQSFLGADLHGAIILVVDCKIKSFIGVGGIMLRETAETFGVITQDDKFRVVPKRGSVFVFQVDCWKITLQGDKLVSRNLSMKSSS